MTEYYFLGRRGGSSVPSENVRDRYVSTGARTAAQAPPKPRRKPLPPLLSNLRSILSNLFSPPGGAGTVELRGCLRFTPHRRRVDDREPSESRPWMHAMVPGVLVRARRRLCGDGTGSSLDTSSPTAYQGTRKPRTSRRRTWKGWDLRVLQTPETLLAETNKRGGRGTGSPGVGGGDLDALQGYAPGFSTGDEACDRVATVLRMLYLLDLRGVQDEINGILALAQTRGKA